jgi:hypothetical protein
VIEGDPILVHGHVADPVANADVVTKPLRDGAMRFTFEGYGPNRSLLLESQWDPDAQQCELANPPLQADGRVGRRFALPLAPAAEPLYR